MKTVLFRRHGGPEVLEYTEFPTPEPKPGEALVRLHAAALNRMDVMVRNGWPGLQLELPHIGGADGAGEVVEVGEKREGEDPALRLSRELRVGDRVVIDPNLGCGECELCEAGWDNL